jgi:hypothetical protein
VKAGSATFSTWAKQQQVVAQRQSLIDLALQVGGLLVDRRAPGDSVARHDVFVVMASVGTKLQARWNRAALAANGCVCAQARRWTMTG